MRITVLDGIGPAAKRVLQEAGHTFGSLGKVYWTRLTPVDTSFLAGTIVATPCTGTDHVRAARVLCLRDCSPEGLRSIRATVEHTIGMILSLTRKLPSAVESVRRGEWDRMRYQGTDLAGKTALVVGMGRIGSAVINVLQSLAMDVIDCDRYQHPHLLEQLAVADLVTVHVDLNPSSRGMFGPAEFAAMKPGAFFCNTSRGAVVDEWALLDALKSGHLAGAALDVLQNEPPDEFGPNPLIEFAREQPERLVITPHLAGCSRESLEKAECLLARKLVEVLKDGG